MSGTIGDGALGLAVAQGKFSDPSGFLLDRYRLPRPRLGFALGRIVSASMDVSDGLVQDLGHICRNSGVAAEVEVALVPLSEPARRAGAAWLTAILTGGDDYEVLMALPPGREDELLAAARAARVAVSRIGQFVAGAPSVRLTGADGRPMQVASGGWSHF